MAGRLGGEECGDVARCAEAGGGGGDLVSVGGQDGQYIPGRAAGGHGRDVEEFAEQVVGGEVALVEHGDQDAFGRSELGFDPDCGGQARASAALCEQSLLTCERRSSWPGSPRCPESPRGCRGRGRSPRPGLPELMTSSTASVLYSGVYFFRAAPTAQPP